MDRIPWQWGDSHLSGSVCSLLYSTQLLLQSLWHIPWILSGRISRRILVYPVLGGRRQLNTIQEFKTSATVWIAFVSSACHTSSSSSLCCVRNLHSSGDMDNLALGTAVCFWQACWENKVVERLANLLESHYAGAHFLEEYWQSLLQIQKKSCLDAQHRILWLGTHVSCNLVSSMK